MPAVPCLLITKLTKSTLLDPPENTGTDPEGNKKYVLNPTVVTPAAEGWVKTIE